MRFLRAILTVSCLLALIGMLPAGAGADSGQIADCKMCLSGTDGNGHSFIGYWPGQNGCSSGGDCYDCHAFNACHTDVQPYACGDRHFACSTLITANSLEELRRDDTRSALGAFAEIAENGGNIQFVRERSAFVILDCEGNAVRTIPASAEVSAMLD